MTETNPKETKAPAGTPLLTFDVIQKNPRVRTFIAKSDEALALIGYTEHGERHVRIVAKGARTILEKLGHSERACELAAIAGYMHDIGNAVNRNQHAQTGAVIALRILDEYKMSDDEIATVIGSIGNHHETDGWAVSEVAAALILADKSDVHRSRVRNADTLTFDIHDRVNYSVERSFLDVDPVTKTITLNLTVDTKISDMMEYFEIFMTRMLASVKAAKFLGTTFGLIVNETRLF